MIDFYPGVLDLAAEAFEPHQLLDELYGFAWLENLDFWREKAIFDQLQVKHVVNKGEEQVNLSDYYNYYVTRLLA